jgi:hypothetical protein
MSIQKLWEATASKLPMPGHAWSWPRLAGYRLGKADRKKGQAWGLQPVKSFHRQVGRRWSRNKSGSLSFLW